MWRTSDGEALRALDRVYGSKSYTTAVVSEIRKSRDGDRYTQALGILVSGIAV